MTLVYPVFHHDIGWNLKVGHLSCLLFSMMRKKSSIAAAAATIIIIIVSLFLQSIVGLEREEFFANERDALIQLRDIVNSSSNLHANWTGPTCNTQNQSRWAGVGCWDWHVTHLVLEGIHLTSSLPLPPLLFHNLTYLTKLSFRNNSLRGPLPNLTNLVNLESLFLSQNQFSGSIPLSYINLPILTKLELQDNALSGQIPPFNQQSLIGFNVSNNLLQGPVPQTSVLQRFPGSSYANNSGLCGDVGAGLGPCPIITVPPPASRKQNDAGGLKPWSIALIAVAPAVLAPLCCYLMMMRKAAEDKEEEPLPGEIYMESRGGNRDEESELMERGRGRGIITTFELDELLRSAAQVIGRGKLGTTYKAMLECGSVVAVKRVEQVMKDKGRSKEEFAEQMKVLRNIKHHNLAEMISFYHSKEEKLIVREYVEGGSLFSLLHENRRGMQSGVVLDWGSRVGIIKEIAKGLEHLHLHLINHGNLKSSNVLIQHHEQGQGQGQGLVVKLTDYGLLGVAETHKLAVGRTPEFVEGKKRLVLTSKADIYCLGILVLEIVTGRAPTTLSDDDLSGWVKEAVSIDWSTDIVDVDLQILGEKEGYEDMLKMTEMALQCTDHLPHRRPDIAQILSTLQLVDHTLIN